MAKVIGQIGPLKHIRNRLNQEGLGQFNTLKELDLFLENYDAEKYRIRKKYEDEVDFEIDRIKEGIKHDILAFENHNKIVDKVLDRNSYLQKRRIALYRAKAGTHKTLTTYSKVVTLFLIAKLRFTRAKQGISQRRYISKHNKKIQHSTNRLNWALENREVLIFNRGSKQNKQLEHTKKVILELNSTVAGAIGENQVVNEIKKLSNDYILINDFSIKFNPPIFNKKENQRIRSIQIDHLLISKAGIFILETKNWGKQSLQRTDLWSPIKQIKRSSYAVYILLKQKNIKLDWHPWGKRKIPIRNVVVMIKEKPIGDFEFATVKTLNELNNYIKFFDPVLTEKEFNKISEKLINLYNRNKS